MSLNKRMEGNMIVNSNENNFLELISKIPNVAVQGYNKEREVIYWNEASESIYGYTNKEALGEKIENLIIPDFMKNDVIAFITNWYEKGEPIPSSELPLQHKNGSTVFVYSSHVMLGKDTDNPEMFCVDIDMTKQKEQEISLSKQHEILIKQSRHAAMGEMIDMIAHQWRQPLSAITMDASNMLLDIALENFNTTEAEKYANHITQQTQHLSQTIDDFRNFFKSDKVISEVNIREILDSTLSILKNSLENNNIELITSYETDKTVKTYPRELTQVFVNIINNSKNALIANKQDNSSINIRVREDGEYINISICDNGGGIDIDILPKVFDPHFSTKDEKTGTGLGLYMSKMIIEEHLHGTIEVYNSDEGVCFTVKLLKKLS